MRAPAPTAKREAKTWADHWVRLHGLRRLRKYYHENEEGIGHSEWGSGRHTYRRKK